MRKFISYFLVLAMVFSITVSTNTASAGTGDTNSQYVVSEQNGLRTVTDQTTGAMATYDLAANTLMVKENPVSKEIYIDLNVRFDDGVIKGGSAYSSNNEYGYKSSGNPALWTLQIPNKIKFTYERTQGALIASFVYNVNELISAEKNMVYLYGPAVLALLSFLGGGGLFVAIIAVLGFGVDFAAIVNGLNSIKTYKQQAKYYFGRIVTYSFP